MKASIRHNLLKALPDGLVAAWCALYAHLDRRLQMERLEEISGVRYPNGRLSEWAKGRRTVPDPAARAMRMDLLAHLITENQAVELVRVIEPLASIRPQERRKKEPHNNQQTEE